MGNRRTNQCTEPEPVTSVSDAPGYADIGFAANACFPAPVGDLIVRHKQIGIIEHGPTSFGEQVE
jgi:hypothetical protein